MSINEVINELPHLSFEERQLLISKALELDDLPLSCSDEKLVEERLSAHYQDPTTSIELKDLKSRLFSK